MSKSGIICTAFSDTFLEDILLAAGDGKRPGLPPLDEEPEAH